MEITPEWPDEIIDGHYDDHPVVLAARRGLEVRQVGEAG